MITAEVPRGGVVVEAESGGLSVSSQRSSAQAMGVGVVEKVGEGAHSDRPVLLGEGWPAGAEDEVASDTRGVSLRADMSQTLNPPELLNPAFSLIQYRVSNQRSADAFSANRLIHR